MLSQHIHHIIFSEENTKIKTYKVYGENFMVLNLSQNLGEGSWKENSW